MGTSFGHPPENVDCANLSISDEGFPDLGKFEGSRAFRFDASDATGELLENHVGIGGFPHIEQRMTAMDRPFIPFR
jgi:hypothetical protein